MVKRFGSAAIISDPSPCFYALVLTSDTFFSYRLGLSFIPRCDVGVCLDNATKLDSTREAGNVSKAVKKAARTLSDTMANNVSGRTSRKFGSLKGSMDLSRLLRQPVKTQFSLNGELCHGIASTNVHA